MAPRDKSVNAALAAHARAQQRLQIERPQPLFNRIERETLPDGTAVKRRVQGRLGVGRSAFYKDYVYQPGGEETVPGTDVPRLRLITLGKRATGAISDEVDQLIDGLRAWRDAHPEQRRPAPAVTRRRGRR